jgi:ornithine cyclodeaminase/alanine dehydrogenase-like protein (mu-crystallin family)
LRILSAEETAAALPYGALVEGLRRTFAAGVEAPPRHHHVLPGNGEPDGVLLLMPAWNDERGGVKVATVTPGNADRGLPAVTASYLVFDRHTGEHRALLDGGVLTPRRTAAASALAADALARRDASSLLILGAGQVAGELPYAYAAIRDVRRVRIWNRTPDRARTLVDRLRKDGWDAEVVDDLAAAVPRADVVCAATLASAPILRGTWLVPGQHVDLIGAFTPTMREADDETLRRARLFVDTEVALQEAGELAIPLREGVIARGDVMGTLYDLAADRAGRGTDDEITLFKSVGASVEDLAAAEVALAHADDATKAQR